MSFVPDCHHDVFVSYAHRDDEPPLGCPHGWVTTLMTEVRRLLTEKLVESDLWMDHKLAGNDPITPVIYHHLESSATLVIVLSPAYLSSEWCRRERDAFLTRIEGFKQQGASIFVIEKEKIQAEDWPAELRDLKGYPFWQIDPLDNERMRTLGYPCPNPTTPDDRNYYKMILDLSDDLVKELKQIKNARDTAPPERIHTAEPTGQRIFLAEVTDDLEQRRQEVRRFLEQHGFKVVPEVFYGYEPGHFREAMQADLAGCRLFVQLLSEFAGKKLPGAEQGFPSLQHEIAAEQGLTVFQWRALELDFDKAEPSQLELLGKPSVIAEPIEHFKARLVRKATEKPAPTPPPSSGHIVFVNFRDEDKELATQVKSIADQMGLGYALPLRRGRPSEIRRDMERKLIESDAIMVLYGVAPETWVHEQLLNYNKLAWKRDRPGIGLALCEFPPPEKEELGMKLPGMEFLDCRAGIDPQVIRRFLEPLQSS